MCLLHKHLSPLEINLFQYLIKCPVCCRISKLIFPQIKPFSITPFMEYPHGITAQSMFWKKYFRAPNGKNICYRKLCPDPTERNQCPLFHIYQCFLLSEKWHEIIPQENFWFLFDLLPSMAHLTRT